MTISAGRYSGRLPEASSFAVSGEWETADPPDDDPTLVDRLPPIFATEHDPDWSEMLALFAPK